MYVEADGRISFDKMVLALLSILLTVVSSFTGYAINSEVGDSSLTKVAIRGILQEELRPIERQLNNTNSQIAVMIFRQDELTRRLEIMEKRNGN